MELANTADNPFDPISELLFLDRSGLLSHGKSSSPLSTANPEIFRHLRQRPVTTPLAPKTKCEAIGVYHRNFQVTEEESLGYK